MSKSIKFTNDTYLDSSGITFNKTPLHKILTYSTEEQIVGKWVDGKELYRKTFIGTLSAGEHEICHNILNVDTIFLGSESFICPVADDIFPINGNAYINATNPEKYEVFTRVNKTIILQKVGEFLTGDGNYTYNITLYYTKTTD